ncbi:MAG TPA: type II toxin-antitoxin system VapC family toxin [Vicinamibacterales bacterium]|nr:type II toxin-antitoxin system VapC family toxin [Vicinamibacterales bacterium]
MRVLVDTNVIAELRKGPRANANVRTWFAGLEPDAVVLSALTIGEIGRGVESLRRRDAAAARVLDRWLRRLVADHGDAVLPVTGAIAEEWGRLSVPDPLPVIDGLLAATARVHHLTLATRNVKDVARTGVDLVNPFEVSAER